MAKLHDMEELVGTIIDDDVKTYMKEALICYMTGAYRATIVLTYIALFDDIFKKLEELSKVNKVARKIFIESSKKRLEQEPFEYDLITSLKSSNLMGELEVDFLDILRTLRNKAAHPSGHLPSAEEARFIYYEAISRFLSKPILSTRQLVEQIIDRMSESNFFHSHEIDIMAKVARKETANLHPEAIPFLISKLLDSLEEESKKDNSQKMLCSMAFSPPTENTLSELRKKIIENKVSNPDYQELICELFSSNGELYNELHEVTYGRVSNLLTETVRKTGRQVQYDFLMHPISVFASLFRNKSAASVIEANYAAFEALTDKHIYSSLFIQTFSEFIPARGFIGKALLEKAGSTVFDKANDFAKKAHQLDKVIAENYTPRFCFRIISAVFFAAKNGAFSAESLVKTNFSSLPLIASKAFDFYDKSPELVPENFIKINGSDDGLEDLLQIISL
ncbi:hypothetical protein [Pantoea ananatis]|uniref:hypothetical protein n=1 Tax=Pantoea ananas TaxID=553 RepID=UPI0011A288AF|nr:hypothetical protein [Pantoea ananatis]